jgi:hypothetical protein
MIKKIMASFCLLISLTALAQEGTSSPYSYYGIGDIKFKGTVENRSMGGVSVFPDSIHMNLQNPAQFASLKLTNLAVGVTSANSKAKSESQEAKSRRTSLDYFAAAFPVKKLGIAFGAIPFSNVGYKIQTISSDAVPLYSRYSGIGGVNKVFVGAGYQLTKKINIGVDFQYNFGTIETDALRFQSEIQYGTRENNSSNLKGYNLDFGMTYQTKINPKISFFSSLTFTPESKLNVNNSRNLEIVQFLVNGGVSVIERQEIDVENTTINLPTKIGIGSGFGQVKKWLVGGEITYLNNAVLSNRFNDINGATFEDTYRYSVGGYFIPNYNSYSDYYKRIVYRAGLRYENTGLIIQNKAITDFAGTIGLGLPITGTFSNINIGLEIGKRGTIFNNLIEENYVNLSIGVSLSEKWFIKRKYD